MPEVITVGETMAVMVPARPGRLRYVSDYHLKIAGAESNVAVDLCKFGHSAGWVSRLGTDEMGYYVRNAVRAEGADTSRVVWDAAHSTGLMMKELGSRETKVFYYRKDSAASHMTKEDLDPEYLKTAKIIHLTGITPVLSPDCQEMVEFLAEFSTDHGIMLSFDPNIRKKLWGNEDYCELLRKLVQKSQIVMLGREEGQILYGTEEPEKLIELLRKFQIDKIAVKDGSNGAWVADQRNCLHIPAFPCRPVDPVGAGDAFNSGFLAGILEGCSLKQCGRMGAAAGALVTEQTGDTEGCPDKEQLQRYLDGEEEIWR